MRLASTRFPSGCDAALSERSREAIRQFEEGMDDDLNTAEALAAIFEYVRAINTAIDAGRFCEDNRWEAAKVLEVFDTVFDVLKPYNSPAALASSAVDPNALTDAEVEALIEERARAKKARDFKRSDEIRAELTERGIVLEDTKDGARWKRK